MYTLRTGLLFRPIEGWPPRSAGLHLVSPAALRALVLRTCQSVHGSRGGMLMPRDGSESEELGSIDIEWGIDMEEMSLTPTTSGGSGQEINYRGRCQDCWGSLIGRTDEHHAWTGIKCRVCGKTVEGSKAAEERCRLTTELLNNAFRMEFGSCPTYDEGPFAFKVFPNLDRLTEEELQSRVTAAISSTTQSQTRSHLTREAFPLGSAGWLFLQAKILLSGAPAKPSLRTRLTVGFPEVDFNDDDSVTTRFDAAGMSQDPDYDRQTWLHVLGSNMRDAMVSAFCCELAMKAICLTFEDIASKSHDLHSLFTHLPEQSQTRVKGDYPEIEAVLLRERQTFGTWRYFERDADGQGMQVMVNPMRAWEIGRAARVFVDEGEIMGLHDRISLNTRQQIQKGYGSRTYNNQVDGSVRGTEWPPRP